MVTNSEKQAIKAHLQNAKAGMKQAIDELRLARQYGRDHMEQNDPSLLFLENISALTNHLRQIHFASAMSEMLDNIASVPELQVPNELTGDSELKMPDWN